MPHDRPSESPPPAEHQHAEEADAPPSGFNPLQILLERWPFLVAGLVIGAVIGVLIHLTAVPQYQSAAKVLVVKKRTELIKDGDIRVGAVEDYVATQVTLIKSTKILLAAAAKARDTLPAADLPADDRELAGVIDGGLGISRDGAAAGTGTAVLNLTFRGPRPAYCRLMLEAVIRAHQAELYAIYDQATTEKLASLDKLADALKERRETAGNERIARLTELRRITTEEVANIRARVSAQREAERTLRVELTDLDDQLALVAKAGPDPRTRQLTLTQLTLTPLAAAARTGPTLGTGSGEPTPTAALRALERQRRELSSRAGLGDGHPRILALDEQIQELKGEVTRPVPSSGGAIDELGAYAGWLEQKRKSVTRRLALIESQRQEDEQDLKRAGGLQDQVDALTTTIQQSDIDIKRLEADKFTAQATQGAGGYTAEQISPPADGGKVAPLLVRSLVTGFGIGAGIGVLMMLLADFTDKSFRSPADIRHRLRLAVIGHIPHLRQAPAADPDGPPALDPSLVTVHRPKSSEAEAYRGLRTQLFFSTQGRGHQVIQITSPSAGDGKSTQAANLAVSIAQSGKRTVLIDCDLRKPVIHKLFKLGNQELGVAGVVAGTCGLAEATVAGVVPGLDVIPCGPRPASPAELLMSPQFLQMLDELRRRYDFVIVDTPPLLAVTDPAIVAPQMDGVIMVFRMTSNVRPLAQRARELLAGVGARMLGVVVNAAARKSLRYGYGQYGGYGGASTYGYRYSYYNYSDNYHEIAA